MNRRTTKVFARQLVHQLQQSNGGIVLLSGPLGAGKTTLVGEMVHLLCPQAMPSSPTYTVINQYAENIFHADLLHKKRDWISFSCRNKKFFLFSQSVTVVMNASQLIRKQHNRTHEIQPSAIEIER